MTFYVSVLKTFSKTTKMVCFTAGIGDNHILLLFFSGLCCGKAMVAYTMPQHRMKEESEQLRG